MRNAAAFVVLPTMLSLMGAAAHAQQGLDVVVESIAGSNLYISAGTASGISVDDTLLVYAEADGVALGAFVVVGATRERAVVAFAGSPFPATRGKALYVVPKRGLFVTAPQTVAQVERPRRSSRVGPQISGRLSLDVNALQTRSEAPAIGVEPTDRTFTTPTARLRMTMANLPGGLRFQLNTRASTRYSSIDLVQSTESYRVYEASLARDWKAVQFQVGRFYNRYETYSGYWDGLLLHLGGDGFGIGGAIGFRPERSNELFSADLPKYTVFANAGHRGRTVRYATDVSFHELRPRNGLGNHMYAGWTQRLQVGGFRVSHNLQVDRDPATDKWVVTRLLARSAVPLGRRLNFRVRYALRQPFAVTPVNLITTRRDQGSVGLGLWLGNGSLGADVTANRVEGQNLSYTYAGSFSFPRTAVLGLGVSSSVSYWVFEDARTVYVSGALSRQFGRFSSRVSYNRYETDGRTTVLTHTGELALTFPLTRRLYSRLQGRVQRGENLNSDNLYGGFWLNF